MNLNKFNVFVNEITQSNSRSYKIETLKQYKDDEDIKYLLNFIFDPYIVTGISTKKLNRTDLVYGNGFGDLKELCEYLKVHNTGRDEDIAKVNTTRNVYPSELHSLFNSVITKDLTIGIDVKTINKVIPNLCREFSVQLAEKYFDDPNRIVGKEFALTTKIDGGRIIALKENGNVTFYTRAGQVYEGLVDLKTELEKIEEDDLCLDGEITLLNPGNLVSKDQYKETMKITRADGEKHGIKMKVFDCLTATEFRNQKCDIPYEMRRAQLSEIFIRNQFTYFELLPILYQGTDVNEITKWLDYNIGQGEEGVMINLLDGMYEFKRTWSLQKVKKMQDLDLEIIDFEEGTGTNLGTLGAVVVDYKGFRVSVGSGFTKVERDEIWNHKADYLGMTCVVKYFEETTNANGGISLRFPIWQGVRTDK